MKPTITTLILLTMVTALRLVTGAPVTTAPLPTPAPWWTQPCNTPRVSFVDGCDEFTRIQRSPAPISPPCIRSATVITATNDDEPTLTDTHLVIVVDHPEYPYGEVQIVDLVQLGQPPGTGQPAAPWETDYGDWSFKCGRDEAPLAWAVREMLDTGSTLIPPAYTRPLPAPFLKLLAELGGISPPAEHRIYLPLVINETSKVWTKRPQKQP